MNPLDIARAAQVCPMDPFDITKAASTYSNIAVVLAGFSFAVLMYVIQSSGGRSHEESNDAERGLALIALTFLGNVAIAVLWAMVSGEPSQMMRPETLGFVATLLFANNTPLTFQAVAFFVAATGNTSLLRLFRWVYLFTVMMAAIFVIVNVAFIHTYIHNASTGACELPFDAFGNSLYGRCLTLLVPLGLFVAWLLNLYSNRVRVTFSAFTFAWLASSLAFVVFFAWVSMQSPGVILPVGWIYVLALFWLLITGWAVVFTPIGTERQDIMQRTRT